MRRNRENQRQSECIEHATPFGPGQRISIRAAVCEQSHQEALYTPAIVSAILIRQPCCNRPGPTYVHTRLTGYDRDSQSWELSPQLPGRILAAVIGAGPRLDLATPTSAIWRALALSWSTLGSIDPVSHVDAPAGMLAGRGPSASSCERSRLNAPSSTWLAKVRAERWTSSTG